MKVCLDQGTLQALVDGEVELDERRIAENHLAVCPECRARFANLKENGDFALEKLQNYQGWIAAQTSVSGSGGAAGMPVVQKLSKVKEVFEMIRRYKNIAAAAVLVIVTAVCITVQPVRAALANALLVLRVEDVKGIKLSLQDIEAIQKQVDSKAPEIDVAKFGKIRIRGGEKENISVEQARALSEFKVAFPQSLNGVMPNIETVSGISLDLALKTTNINQTLKSLGSQTPLPETLDGKVFHIDFSRVVNLEYKLAGNQQVRIMQMRSPELTAPANVDVDQLYSALIELPIFPADLRNQLRAVKDWKNTLLIPVVDQQLTEITINGHKGFVGTAKPKRSNIRETMVIWLNNGIINTLHGNIEPGAALNLAGSMQ